MNVIPGASTLIAVLIVFGLLLALLRRPWTAAALTLCLLGFIVLGSMLKQSYLGVALTLADVEFFLQRLRPNLRLFVTYPALGAVLALMFAVALAGVGAGARLEPPVRALDRPRRGPMIRTAMAACALALGGIAALQAGEEDPRPVGNDDSYAAFLAMDRAQHPGGMVDRLDVFFEYRSYGVTLPRSVHPSRFRAPADGAFHAGGSPGVRPDIFLVLEESTFDTRLLQGCPPEYCDPAMLHAPAGAARTQQGPLLVHTTGGGTILSEFGVLTGLDWRAFGRGGAYAPISLAPRLHDSLALRLRELGYRTIAVYPTDGEFLSARSAYRFYGFDEFLDAAELGLPSDWSDVSDAQLLGKALATFGRATDRRPVFIFALTIRNHGPHGAAANAVPTEFAGAVAHTSFAMADYLARLHASSQAYSALAERWLAGSRPRVIGWFGDHQPEAAWDLTGAVTGFDAARLPANVGRAEQMYLTYYQMSANYGARGEASQTDALDIAHLGATLLSFARLPLDPGARAALQVATACHGLLLECPDHSLVQDYLGFRVRELGALD